MRHFILLTVKFRETSSGLLLRHFAECKKNKTRMIWTQIERKHLLMFKTKNTPISVREILVRLFRLFSNDENFLITTVPDLQEKLENCGLIYENF